MNSNVELTEVNMRDQPIGYQARRIFLAWEKLRIGYIAVLVVETLALCLLDNTGLVGSLDFWKIVVEGAIVANVAYFAGPLLETYVTWLGFRGERIRLPLFFAGTFFACLLALVAVFAIQFGHALDID